MKEEILKELIVLLANANAHCEKELGTRAETRDMEWTVRAKVVRAFLTDLLRTDDDEELAELMSAFRYLLEDNFRDEN